MTGGFATSYAYDELGRATQLRTSSDEDTRTYTYDARGSLTTLALPSDNPGMHTTYLYDDSGLLEHMSLPESSTVAYRYDAAGRLDSIDATTASATLAYAYTRDAAGNVTDVSGTRYAYDELDRLISWYDPSRNATTTYAYDGASNLTSVSRDGSVTASFAFDDADRISSPGFAYDAAGNMTADGELDYVYDSQNRLTVVRDASAEETLAVYAYDFLNRRVSATEGTTTTYFHYDGGSPLVLAETGGAGDTIASYAYDASGRLHSMTRGDESYYYILNGHGDVVALTDDAGHVVNEYAYDPYGNSVAATETVVNPYRYAGYRFDEASGLYYCWNRYYDAQTYRIITRDIYPGELANPATMNAYAYCLGNPVAWVDPSGMFTFGAGIVIGGHAFGIGGSLSVSVVGDDKGNLGIAVTKGYQGGTVPAGMFAVQLQPTGASTICDLEGVSGGGGGSIGPVGAEGWTAQGRDGSYYGGANVQLGVGGSAYGVPFEAHGALDDTDVYGFNIGDLLGL